MSTVLINGSPRARGRSAALELLVSQKLELLGEQDISFYRVADDTVKGCVACDYCVSAGTCVFTDAMDWLIPALGKADRVVLISPIYFAGVPSQLKAVLDRLQPLFHKRMALLKRKEPLPCKKPLHLLLVGEGGDPHGFDPAITMVKSAFQLADFAIADVHAFIGDEQPRTIEDLDFIKELP